MNYGRNSIDREYENLHTSYDAINNKIRAYIARDASSVPRLFLEETERVVNKAIVETPFVPTVAKSHEMVRGVSMQTLLGYVGTKAKSGSQTILTAPGELSPSLVYGTDPDYTGDSLWNGKTFLCRDALNGETAPAPKLLAVMPLLLGNKLPAEVHKALLAAAEAIDPAEYASLLPGLAALGCPALAKKLLAAGGEKADAPSAAAFDPARSALLLALQERS